MYIKIIQNPSWDKLYKDILEILIALGLVLDDVRCLPDILQNFLSVSNIDDICNGSYFVMQNGRSPNAF
jgi:hypothetical protein